MSKTFLIHVPDPSAAPAAPRRPLGNPSATSNMRDTQIQWGDPCTQTIDLLGVMNTLSKSRPLPTTVPTHTNNVKPSPSKPTTLNCLCGVLAEHLGELDKITELCYIVDNQRDRSVLPRVDAKRAEDHK